MLRTVMGCVVGTLLAAGLGCSDDETEYNFIDRFRVLGVSAEPPWLEPNETTTLSALVVPEEGTRVEYIWEWCPLTLGVQTGYACAVTRDELQAQVDAQVGPGVFEVPSFSIGTATVAEYTYDLPVAVVREVCDLIQQQELPPLTDAPDCTDGFPLTVISTIRQIDIATHQEGPTDSAGPTRIRAIKPINLLLDDREANRNPALGELFVIDPRDGSRTMVAHDGSTVVDHDVAYTLEVELGSDESQPYLFTPPDTGVPEMRREDLTLTWFIEAGSTEFIRTGFIENVSSLEQARTNQWTTPRALDYERDTARVFIVIRDGRLGTSWIERTFALATSS